MGAQFFRDVWNPSITVLPFVLLVLRRLVDELRRGVGAAGRRRRSATFLVQTHVSYGLVTTATVWLAGLVGAAITAWRRRADGAPRERVRSWLPHGSAVTVGRGRRAAGCPSSIQQVTR